MAAGRSASGTLTALGRRQALRVGKRLAGLPITAIHHSDVVRAVETAEIMAECLPQQLLHRTPLLREVVPPSPRGLFRDYHLPQSEKGAMRAQCERAFQRFFRPARRGKPQEVLVSHGNLIRYLVRRALEDDARKWYRLVIHQCSITTVLIESRAPGPLLVAYNDTGHLPRSMRTEL
jgi:probable phosphoglycerate mutase